MLQQRESNEAEENFSSYQTVFFTALWKIYNIEALNKERKTFLLNKLEREDVGDDEEDRLDKSLGDDISVKIYEESCVVFFYR